MANVNDILQNIDSSEEREDYIQSLLLSVQFALQKAMIEGGVSKKDLSERLGVSLARVSQILSDTNANLTIKTIGRICHALGEEFELVRKAEYKNLLKKRELLVDPMRARVRESRRSNSAWQDHTANINKFPQTRAAA
ncbi:helix-turn-helix transcriptional regulator [Paracoccus sp. SSK6]|uniref:helix-turn-helix domain-containing protein n=1 Tax=Paracoccus sp. SSK6 TaxID=3143131 RepID=UPI00321983E1